MVFQFPVMIPILTYSRIITTTWAGIVNVESLLASGNLLFETNRDVTNPSFEKDNRIAIYDCPSASDNPSAD
jgi:hypothetical protein